MLCTYPTTHFCLPTSTVRHHTIFTTCPSAGRRIPDHFRTQSFRKCAYLGHGRPTVPVLVASCETDSGS